MPDSTIGELPQVGSLDDDSLMVVEQQGSAMKMTGRQFKDFGRQSVIDEVQGLVDEAKAAANSITNMTVEAHTAETPTVEKTMKNNVVNLDFGLPQGPAGPRTSARAAGQTGRAGTARGAWEGPDRAWVLRLGNSPQRCGEQPQRGRCLRCGGSSAV